jgi:hypothetical protein
MNIKEIIKEFKGLLYEKCYVYKDDTLILSKKGKHSYIKFTDYEIERVKNSDLLIHSHPVEDWSLSLNDICFALECNIKTIIAITPKNVCIFKIKDRFNLAFLEDINERWYTLRNYKYFYIDIATDDLNHHVLLELVSDFPDYFEYQKISIREFKGRV